MARWCTCHAAVRWILLVLLVSPALGQSVETTEDALQTTADTTFYTEIPNEESESTTFDYQMSTKTVPVLQENTKGSTDPQRSERMMIVYVKPNSTSETKNISDLLDSDDIFIQPGDTEMIVITDPTVREDDTEDDDFMLMEARSLRHNFNEDVLASEAETFESLKETHLKEQDLNLKEILHKWNRDFNFNLTDLFKINIASVLAKEYDEMHKLMSENLVEDTDVFMRAKEMAEGFEPREYDTASSDVDQSAEATEEVVSQQILPPPKTVPQPVIPNQPLFKQPTPQRPSGQTPKHYQGMISPLPFFQIGPLMHHPNQRSDPAPPPSYLFLPRGPSTSSPGRPETKTRPVFFQAGNGQRMTILPIGPSMRLPMTPLNPPRTAVQRASQEIPLPRTEVHRPQPASNPTRLPGRFGERFPNRLPRPFQYVLNMTIGGRQPSTTQRPPTLLPSSVSHFPAPSQNYPARVRAPNGFNWVSAGTQKNVPAQVPPIIRNRPQVATVSAYPNRFPKLGITSTTGSPAKGEFGERIRPIRFDRQRNSTNITQNVKPPESKEQREMKINQLRSNLVGKLVVLQTMLDNKQDKSGKPEMKGSQLNYTSHFNRKGLPNGILKPIVPLRPRHNVETTSTPTSTTDGFTTEETIVTTESTFAVEDRKKYRRPPSFRKGGKTSLANQTQESVLSATSLRKSVVVMKTPESSPLSSSTDIPNQPDNQNKNLTESTADPVEITTLLVPVANTTENLQWVEETENGAETSTRPTKSLEVPLEMTMISAQSTASQNESDESTAAPESVEVPEFDKTNSISAANATETFIGVNSDYQVEPSYSTEPAVPLLQELTLLPETYSTENLPQPAIETEAATIVPEPVVVPLLKETSSQEKSNSTTNSDKSAETENSGQQVPMSEDDSVHTGSEILKTTSLTKESAQEISDKRTDGQRETPFTTNPVLVPVVETMELTSSSTYAPEEDPYLKAMIQRALEISDEEDRQEIASKTNNFTEDESEENVEERILPGKPMIILSEVENVTSEYIVSHHISSNETDRNSSLNVLEKSEDLEYDDDLDFSEHEIATKEGEDEDQVDVQFSDSVISRVDRSVEISARKTDSPNNLERSVQSNLADEHRISAAINLARGRFRPINLPFNILPSEEETK